MPFRARAILALALAAATFLGAVPGSAPAPAAAGGQKVVIIVGPVGSQTDNYREKGDRIAETAEAAGATVVKVYSPNATWDNVRAAVNGANMIVYVGHGNGYPNPYSSGHEWTGSRQRLGPEHAGGRWRRGHDQRRHGLLRREGPARDARAERRRHPAAVLRRRRRSTRPRAS